MRRASGVDGIFVEQKLQGEDRKEERRRRPTIALPANWSKTQISDAMKREGTEGTEGMEIWGKRLMMRVLAIKEAELRLAFTGKEAPPADQLWSVTGLPNIRAQQFVDFCKLRLQWDVEEAVGNFRTEKVDRKLTIRANAAPPDAHAEGSAWQFVMSESVVRIDKMEKRTRSQRFPAGALSRRLSADGGSLHLWPS